MKKLFTVSIFLILVSSSNIQAQFQNPQSPPTAPKSEIKFPESSAFVNSKITYKIIDAASGTFCYDIFSDGKLLIHQPSVPGMPGNKGFKDKASAEKVADLVISKIKKGEMPPTVTTDEMKKVKAVY